MESAGKSLLRSSGLRAAADDLGAGQKLLAAAGQRAALAGAFPENLLKRRPRSTCAAQLECPLWVKSKRMQCNRPCPLYPRKQTCAVQKGMSAMGQKRTHGLLDHSCVRACDTTCAKRSEDVPGGTKPKYLPSGPTR